MSSDPRKIAVKVLSIESMAIYLSIYLSIIYINFVTFVCVCVFISREKRRKKEIFIYYKELAYMIMKAMSHSLQCGDPRELAV